MKLRKFFGQLKNKLKIASGLKI
ncbi:MAG: hypothetical protein RIT49_514, partial [Actinomycetota bacterium]